MKRPPGSWFKIEVGLSISLQSHFLNQRIFRSLWLGKSAIYVFVNCMIWPAVTFVHQSLECYFFYGLGSGRAVITLMFRIYSTVGLLISDTEYCCLVHKKDHTNHVVLKHSMPLVLNLFSVSVETNYLQMPCLIYCIPVKPNLHRSILTGWFQLIQLLFFQHCCHHYPLCFRLTCFAHCLFVLTPTGLILLSACICPACLPQPTAFLTLRTMRFLPWFAAAEFSDF